MRQGDRRGQLRRRLEIINKKSVDILRGHNGEFRGFFFKIIKEKMIISHIGKKRGPDGDELTFEEMSRDYRLIIPLSQIEQFFP